MPTETKKKPKYRLKVTRFLLIVAVIVILYVMYGIVDQQSEYSAQLVERVQLKEENMALERELQYYQNAADFIGTDEYVEQEARTRLGWLMPDEVKYVAGSEDTTYQAPPQGERTQQGTQGTASPQAGAEATGDQQGYVTAPSPSASQGAAGAEATPTASASETSASASPSASATDMAQ